MTWESWKADLIALVIILLIVAPFALYGPLWLRNQGQGGPSLLASLGVVTCELEK